MKGQSAVRSCSCTSARSASIRTPLPRFLLACRRTHARLPGDLLVALVHIAHTLRVMRLACVPLPCSRPSQSASRRPENEPSAGRHTYKYQMPPNRFTTLATRGLHITMRTFVDLCGHSLRSATRGRPYQGRYECFFFRTEDAHRTRRNTCARAHGLGCAASAAPRH
ncbi:hypothetical protein FB451DRAFT_148319 [Mycena latifolia]|nr:hypothetical protein FB451DRAFT_148319 [Mycena latifolia]